MVVNFQSWLDPFIIITALPGTLVGIVWSLCSGRRRQRAGVDGAIMSIAWPRLTVSAWSPFANEQRLEGSQPSRLPGGRTHSHAALLMTAAAMVIGMLPMSLGLGEGANRMPARTSGDRRPAGRDVHDAARRARGLQPAAAREAGPAGGGMTIGVRMSAAPHCSLSPTQPPHQQMVRGFSSFPVRRLPRGGIQVETSVDTVTRSASDDPYAQYPGIDEFDQPVGFRSTATDAPRLPGALRSSAPSLSSRRRENVENTGLLATAVLVTIANRPSSRNVEAISVPR